MRLTTTKEFEMCIAHNLKNHNGKCKFIHGHNYKMLVTVRSTAKEMVDSTRGSTNESMIVDFHTLKTVVNDVLVSKYDHSLILYKTEGGPTNFNVYNDVFGNLSDIRLKEMNIHYVPWRPTVENMCVQFSKVLGDAFRDSCPSIELVKLRIYETDSSYAEIEFDE